MGATTLSYTLKTQTITKDELHFIEACLLGDGTLSASGKYHRLRIAHKQAHKEYVFWKHFNLQKLCVSAPSPDMVNNSLRFGTIGHPEITKLHDIWYQPTKQIPNSFKLNERAIAIWLMDDGCKIHNTVNFSIHNFNDTSIALLRQQLLNMNIITSVQSDGKGKRLYVMQESYPILKKLVKPYIISCMAYKLP